MKIKIQLILYLILFVNTANAGVIKLDTIINLDTKYESSKIKISSFKSNLYSIYKSTNDSIYFQMLNLDTYSKRYFTLATENSESEFNWLPQGFGLNDKWLVVGWSKLIIVYFKMNDKWVYKYMHKFKENRSFLQFKLINDAVFMGEVYPRSNNKNKASIFTFNLRNKKIEKEFNPYFRGIEYTYFAPNKFIDFNDNGSKTLISQTLDYKIDIYNDSFELEYTLKKSKGEWQSIDTTELITMRDEFKIKKVGPMNRIERLRQSFRSNSDIMRKVQFLNDSMIIAFYSPSNKTHKKDMAYDIWIFKNNKWILKYNKLVDGFPNMNAKFTYDNFLFAGLYSDFIFLNNNIYSLKFEFASADVLMQVNKTYGEIFKEMDEFFIENDLEFRLFIYKLNLE